MNLDPFEGVLGLDIESASACSIKNGAWAYSQHPSTRVLCVCLGYAAKKGAPYLFYDWTPGANTPLPREFSDYIRAGGRLLAHNAGFEKSIWANILGKHYGWPETDLQQWRDSQAQGLAVNLPMALEGLAKTLGCPTQKDMEGAALMKEMAVAEPDDFGGWDYDQDPGRLARLILYCRRDVAATLDSFFRLPPLPVMEQRVFIVDQKINRRGVWLDQEFAARCERLAKARAIKLADETFATTGGELLNATSTPALKAWLLRLGVGLPKVTKKSEVTGVVKTAVTADKNAIISVLARPDLPAEVRAVLAARGEANKVTSLAKLKRVPLMVGDDGRLRFSLHFHGASTGRWTSSGLQLHNLPRSRMDEGESKLVRTLIDLEDLDGLETFQGNVLDSISQSLRSVLAAPPGRELIAADFSGIEARVIAWLAGQFDLLQKFADKDAGRGEDIYVYAARMIVSTNRQLGKLCVLGLGFGMGALKFAATAAQNGVALPLKEARRIQKLWRVTIGRIVDFWQALEDAARDAIGSPGKAFSAGDGGKIVAMVKNSVLYLRLPSGRCIRYYRPKVVPCIKKIDTVDDEGNIVTKEMHTHEIRYFTMGPDKSSMVLESTYGGKLCVAAGTLVLTDRGWVALEDVRRSDLVHDGVEFVRHEGLIEKGVQRCVTVDGVWMTPDHEVLTNEGWRPASSKPEPYRPPLRSLGCNCSSALRRQEAVLGVPLRLRSASNKEGVRRDQGSETRGEAELRLLDEGVAVQAQDAWHDVAPGLLGVAVDAGSLSAADASSVAQLWSAWHSSVSTLDDVRSVLGGHGSGVSQRADSRTQEQRPRLQPEQLPMGDLGRAVQQQAQLDLHRHAERPDDGSCSSPLRRDRRDDDPLPYCARLAEQQAADPPRLHEPHRVYDLMNCGPRRRFVVRGESGPVVLSNCENVTQGVARDLLGEAAVRLDQVPPYDEIVVHVHDSIASEVNYGAGSVDEFCAIMRQSPPWGKGLPIGVEGYRGQRFEG